MATTVSDPRPVIGKGGNLWLWLAVLLFPAGLLLLLLFVLPFMPVKNRQE